MPPRSTSRRAARHGVPLAELGLANEALATYEALERDQSRWPTLDAVEAALDLVARDPGAREARLRRFRDPPCFAVPVSTPEGDWIVLWRPVTEDDVFVELSSDDVFVLYLGPLPG